MEFKPKLNNGRSGTTQTLHEDLARAQESIEQPPDPPEHLLLREKDWPHWRAIVARRPRAEWNDNDLIVAASLARVQADIEDWQRDMDSVGAVYQDDEGVHRKNPMVQVLDAAMRQATALRRQLGLVALKASMSAADIKRKGQADNARHVAAELMQQPLLRQ